MGLLDSLASQVLGGGNTQNTLMTAVMGLVGNQQSGGIGGLVEQFSKKGLGDIINSWVGTGANLPITPEQVQQGLGNHAMTQLASQAGISTDEVASHLSQLLPQLVDKLTPNGTIPQGDIMSQGMNLLKGFLK